ncbi:Shedu anti-phage system protein SduA domain-containing protein [Planctomycetota bacterium]
MQRYFEDHPEFLVQVLGGGHGRWVIPQKRLGSEHVTDFLLGERHSFGYEWLAVELESPKRRMFNRSGDPSATLTHAIRQIHDWRGWLKRNQPYASRPREESGLGLPDIDCNVTGLVLIGRRDDVDPSTNELRRQMVTDLRIQIHSYDYVLDPSPAIGILQSIRSANCPWAGRV